MRSLETMVMNTSCCSLVIAVALAVTPLLPNGRAIDQPRNEINAAAGSSWVCVVNKVTGTPDEYCTYNAIRCKDGSKTSLDNPNCNLMQGDCSNAMNDANCFDVPDPIFEESSGHPVTGGLEEKGLTKPQADGFVPKL